MSPLNKKKKKKSKMKFPSPDGGYWEKTKRKK